MTIAAIETSYAGCRFRSRLEARWAVLFDHLGIEWEYEPQGYEFDGQRYLPDFRLPKVPLTVEIKGVMNADGMRKIVGFARHGHAVLVLGDIPRPDALGPHHWLFKGEDDGVTAWRVSLLPCQDIGYGPIPFGWPQTLLWQSDADLVRLFDNPPASGWVQVPAPVAAAYTAARSARFEHGANRTVTQVATRAATRRPFVPPAPPAPLRLDIGDRVMHDKYGAGTVRATDGEGHRATVTIDFDVAGSVRLMLIGGIPLHRMAS